MTNDTAYFAMTSVGVYMEVGLVRERNLELFAERVTVYELKAGQERVHSEISRGKLLDAANNWGTPEGLRLLNEASL